MYMFPLMHDIYAVTPLRLWWAPWRWALHVYYFQEGIQRFPAPERLATNLSKSEVVGLIKLLGYHHEISY